MWHFGLVFSSVGRIAQFFACRGAYSSMSSDWDGFVDNPSYPATHTKASKSKIPHPRTLKAWGSSSKASTNMERAKWASADDCSKWGSMKSEDPIP